LAGQLGRAKIQMDVVTALRGIANSGFVGALPKVTPFLNDDRESVRVAAVRALQSMRDPRVDDILATRMRTDGSNDVRVSAIVAAQVRDPSQELAQGLVGASTESTDPTVRYRAVELMTRWLSKRPDLKPTLESIAKTDQEARVRDLANAAL
jgi:HEAT repeat protein